MKEQLVQSMAAAGHEGVENIAHFQQHDSTNPTCVSPSSMQFPPHFALCEVICSIDFDSSVMFIMRLPVIVGACSDNSTGFQLADIALLPCLSSTYLNSLLGLSLADILPCACYRAQQQSKWI